MIDTILKEIQTLMKQQPLLTIIDNDCGVTIIGKYKICIQLDGEIFEDQFAIEIFVTHSFPDDIPTVKSTDGRITAKNYNGHAYSNGEFCLETDTAIATFIQEIPSILAFLETFLDLYLFGFLFFHKHNRLPFGEHNHGICGLLDSYCELFEINDYVVVYEMLRYLINNNIEGHDSCPCHSGRLFRDCHQESYNAYRKREMYPRYARDFKEIENMINQATRKDSGYVKNESEKKW